MPTAELERDRPEVPEHCGKSMLAVIDRSTGLNPVNQNRDTPIWWCVECHYKVPRQDVLL